MTIANDALREFREPLMLLSTRRFGTFWVANLLSSIETWAQADGRTLAVVNTSANTLIQSTADPKLLGQAASLFKLAMRGGLPLGSLLTGLSVEFLGVQHALLVNGILAVIAQLLIIYFRTRSTLRLEEKPSSSQK